LIVPREEVQAGPAGYVGTEEEQALFVVAVVDLPTAGDEEGPDEGFRRLPLPSIDRCDATARRRTSVPGRRST
jgi:hypothetical protein